MRELIEYDIVKHFKYETLTKEQQKAGLYTYRIVSLDAYIRKPENISSSPKHCMMAVLMGSMLSLIRYLPDQLRCFFQKSIMENIPISNKNTDSKDFSKSQGAIPWLFYFLTLFTY